MKDCKLIFSTFTIFFTVFENIQWSNPTLAGWISNGSLLLFMLINYTLIKYIFVSKYKMINICALIFAIIIIYSGYANADMSFDIMTWDKEVIKSLTAKRPDHAIYDALKIVFFLLFFQHINRLNKIDSFFRYFFNFFLLYASISNIDAILYTGSNADGYLAGNKFDVSYNNLILATLYYLKHPKIENNRRSAKILKIILLISLIVSAKTQCTTAIMGTLFFYIFVFLFRNAWKTKLYRWQTYILVLFVCDILFFFFTIEFINNPIIEFLIVDILGEDLTLTGRVGIYASLVGLLSDCPLYGYGLGNAHLFTVMSGIGSNAQNGLFNLMLEVGIIGCIVYIFMIIKMLKMSPINNSTYPIVCFIYVMLLLSAIEITFSTTILIMAMMLIMYNKLHSNQRTKISA